MEGIARRWKKRSAVGIIDRYSLRFSASDNICHTVFQLSQYHEAVLLMHVALLKTNVPNDYLWVNKLSSESMESFFSPYHLKTSTQWIQAIVNVW